MGLDSFWSFGLLGILLRTQSWIYPRNLSLFSGLGLFRRFLFGLGLSLMFTFGLGFTVTVTFDIGILTKDGKLVFFLGLIESVLLPSKISSACWYSLLMDSTVYLIIFFSNIDITTSLYSADLHHCDRIGILSTYNFN